MADFYPMPSFATFAVRDLEASTNWYRDVLGFTVVFVMPGLTGPALVHLRWAKYADLMLRPRAAAEDVTGAGVVVTFAMAGNLDQLAQRAHGLGARIVRAPGDRPWNARDFTVADPDGFLLTFTMGPLDKSLTIGQVAGKAARAAQGGAA